MIKDLKRTVIAFLVAPLVVPMVWTVYAVIEAPSGAPWHVALKALALMAYVSAFVTYLGVVIFGIPIYLFLRRHKLTAFWIAPVVGFIVGGAMVHSLVGAPPALLFGGPVGALVGTLLWLIDRPDRRA